jgi:nucleoid-associated protein YgaU
MTGTRPRPGLPETGHLTETVRTKTVRTKTVGTEAGSGPAAGRVRAAGLLSSAVIGWAVVTLLLVRVTSSAAAQLARPGPALPEDAVTLITGAGGLVTAAWLALATLVTVLAATRPRSWAGTVAARTAGVIAPDGLRRVVLLAIGVGLVGAAPAVAAPVPPVGGPVSSTAVAVAGPATAPLDPGWAAVASAGDRLRATAPGAGSRDLDPGWVPAPATAATTPGTARNGLPGPAVRPRQQTEDAVVVRRGDCLWTIAARQLGPAATDSRTAAEWPRWYSANRAVLGPRPDLLDPGQRLHPPPRQASDRPDSHDRSGGPR